MFFINSPLDQFEIRTFLGFTSPFFDLSAFNFTIFSLYTVIVLSIVLALNLLTDNNNKVIGSRWFVSQEALYDTVWNMIKSQIGGPYGGFYFPFIYTLFIFVFIANLVSMIPYTFALASHLVFIVSLSITIWLGATIIAITYHKLDFFGFFVPEGTPLPLVPVLVLIELLSYMARAISLGLRLSANILSGHLLMSILSGLTLTLMSVSIVTFVLGFIPLMGILAILFLEYAIAMIQAYVLSVLTAGYLKDALYLH